MKTIITLVLLLIFFNSFSQNLKRSFYYSNDVYSLSAKQEKELKKIIDSIAGVFPGADYFIKGYADSNGTSEYNDGLSLKRAQKIESVLLKKGIRKDLLHIEFFGEKQVLEQLNANRRTDLLIVPWKITGIEELYKLLKEPSESFWIDPSKDTILVGRSGSIISIPANALKTNSKSKVKILLDEYLTKSKMLLHNLSTTSGEKILESGGMISLFAMQDDDTLDLTLNKEISIAIPTDTLLPDMLLFNGERTNQGIMDWRLSQNSWGRTWDGHVDSINGSPFRNWGNMLTEIPYRSALCDSLVKLGDEAFVVNFSFSQKVFYSKKKKKRLRTEKLNLKTQRDSCNLHYARNKEYNDDIRKNNERIRLMQEEMLSKSKEKWLEEKEKEFEKDSGKQQMNIVDVQYYVYNLNQLGFINSDRFAKLGGIKVYIKAKPLAINIDAKLIFRDIKSVLPGSRGEDAFLFQPIPAGTKTTIVGLKYENGKAFLFMKDIVVSENTPVIEMNFKEVSIQELKKAFLTLDK